MMFHYPLAYLGSDEMSMHILIFVSLYVICHFSLPGFKILFLCLVYYHETCYDFPYVYPVCGLLSFLEL